VRLDHRSFRARASRVAGRPVTLAMRDSALSGTIERVSETREPLRRTFDTAADLYEAARPSYPEELFDDLVALAGSSYPAPACWRLAARPAKRRVLCSSAASRWCASRWARSSRSERAATWPGFRLRSTSRRSKPGRASLKRSTSSTRRDRLALGRSGDRVPQGPRTPAPRRPRGVLERRARVPRRLRSLLR
jgi:hypothetical protein